MKYNIYHVYIMTNKPMGVLYVGVTNDLLRRVYEHKYDSKGFVRKYGLNQFVYAKPFYNVEEAIAHEKRVKKWNRKWKINVIEKSNPEWKDITIDYYLRVFHGEDIFIE